MGSYSASISLLDLTAFILSYYAFFWFHYAGTNEKGIFHQHHTLYGTSVTYVLQSSRSQFLFESLDLHLVSDKSLFHPNQEPERCAALL